MTHLLYNANIHYLNNTICIVSFKLIKYKKAFSICQINYTYKDVNYKIYPNMVL